MEEFMNNMQDAPLTQPQEAVRELEILYRATSSLIGVSNADELFERIIDVLHNEMGFPNCDIELLDELTRRLINVGSRGRYKKLPLRVDSQGLIALAVRTGQIVNVPDVLAHEDYLMAVPETRSELVVPLMAEGKIIGALNLESPRPGAFSDRDARLLASFADRAAVAIRASLTSVARERDADRMSVPRPDEECSGEAQSHRVSDGSGSIARREPAEEELRQRNRELSTLYTIALAISRDPSSQSVLHNTLFELMRVLSVPYGCIYIKHGSNLVLQSYRGFSPEAPGFPLELDLARHDWLGEVRVERREFAPASGEGAIWDRMPDIRAWISVPLRSKEEIIGVIQLASSSEDHLSSANISLMTAVASHMAIALENARLYEQMRASEEKHRSIFENVTVGLYQSSPKGKILTANPSLVRLLGFDSLDELLATDISHDLYVDPADREKALEILHRTGWLESTELRLRRKDGREITVLESARAVADAGGRVLYYEGTLMDITEKKALEYQLLQAQKMESIGTLAGGIAHDFNNLLTGILGYASLMLNQSKPGDPHHQGLMVIEQSARRAAELTEKLLAFSRHRMTQLKPTDLNAVVDETLTLLRRSLGSSIEIEVKKETTWAVIEADATQIQQVLMNLCINARDAMPGGGSLRIETANAVLSETDCCGRLAEAQPGTYVVMRVRDTGTGIASQNLPLIFDPFFSTKEINKGTGLGLSTAYGIIKSHRGFIQVESQLGQGTEFSVYLPATQKSLPVPPPVPARAAQGRETILVVDDETIVRQLAKAILERKGYTVLTAEDGLEALQIYEQQGDNIDLIILDLTMPRMNGRACYQELRKANPNINVILSSGYSADEAVQDLLDEGTLGFIQKPYRVEDLTRAVSEKLERKGTRS
jgi:PAS domain S-box-containing protein